MSAECDDCGRDIEYPAGSWPLGECSYCRLADERDQALRRVAVAHDWELTTHQALADSENRVEKLESALREIVATAESWNGTAVQIAQLALAARSPSRTEREAG